MAGVRHTNRPARLAVTSAGAAVSVLVATGLLAGAVTYATAETPNRTRPAVQAPAPTRADRLAAQLARERAVHRATIRRVRVLERVVRHDPTVTEAIRLASFIYRVPESTLRSLAFCESRMNPYAVNPSSRASGLMQFLPSTWAGNYYGRAGFSVWSPYANALGAAQHISRYGTGAWECRA